MSDPYEWDLSGTMGPHDKSYCPGDDSTGCIDGRIYQPCGHENCYGLCEYGGDCECSCHLKGKAS